MPPHEVYRRWRHRMTLTPGREHLRRALLAGGLLVLLGFWNLADQPGPPGGGEGGPGWAQMQLLLRALAWIGLVVAILSRRIASIGLTVEEQRHIAELRRQARETGTPRVLIWGLAAFALSFALLVGVFTVRPPHVTDPGSVQIVFLPGRLLLLLAAAGPFVMTACGLAGLRLIRHSHPRRPGLHLALFEALAVPLLLFDGLIVWTTRVLIELLTQDHVRWSRAMPFGLLLCVLINFAIVRWVWRAMSRPAAGSAHPER